MGNQRLWSRIYGTDGEPTDANRAAVCHRMLSNVNPRLNRENLNSFVPRWKGSKTEYHFTSTHTLRLGELKLSTTEYTVDLNMSGRNWTLLTYRNGSLTPYIRFYWGPTKKTWDLAGGYKTNGTKVRYCLSIPMACGADQFNVRPPGSIL